MSVATISPTKTKILLTLTQNQKEIIQGLATSKGLSISAFLRLKALEDVQTLPMSSNSGSSKIAKYLSKKVNIPKKFKEYQSFEEFHKASYRP